MPGLGNVLPALEEQPLMGARGATQGAGYSKAQLGEAGALHSL